MLRSETERPEVVEAGTVKLVGVNEDDIYNIASELLVKIDTLKAMAKAVNPYGDGNASKRIVQAILHYFRLGDRPEEFRKI